MEDSIATAKRTIIAGLDVGSTKIATCVGQFQDGIVDIIGLGYSPSSGTRKGMVVDIEETVSSISQALEEAEQMCGAPITTAVIGITGPHIQSTISKGVIAISRADGEISEHDVDRVIQAAKVLPNTPNRDILHIIPRQFTVDSADGVSDPVGMSGIRLETEAVIISCATMAIKNLTKCVFQSGIDIQEIVYSPLATAKALITKKQSELGVVLLDIGAQTTTLTIFEEGDVLHTAAIPLGSNNITNDIAIGLRTSIDTAEKIKISHGAAKADQYNDKDQLDLSTLSDYDNETVSLKYVSEIIEARLNEILLMVRDELRNVGRDGLLPAGVVLTGGGCQISGLTDLVKETLRLPASIGRPQLPLSGMVDKLNDPLYSTSVGLMMWNVDNHTSLKPNNRADFTKVGAVVDKARGFFKQFIP
ncbi:MAG: cell division protein FtsA [Patescibacteria group bacterium]|jgi:cell division protein FtsA